MANGDIAKNSAGWSTVPSTDDIRNGFDWINYALDKAALASAFGGWSLSGTAATGWSTYTDPGGNTSGTLVGGFKNLGNLILMSFRITYTGATLTASSGDIADTIAVTGIGSAFRPAGTRQLIWSKLGGAAGVAAMRSDGTLAIVSLDSSVSLASGTVCQFDGVIPL